MSASYYYGLCCKNIGRAVSIKTIDGRIHRGLITRVTPTKVYLRPLGRNRRLGGFGLGYYGGYGWGGFGLGFGLGIAFGAIATLAFLPFFFW
ncbi:hypothetical protein [Bacillus alveayuensis]|jgi:hypothetical protein|uniref:hypothetical protein n=1 Tax=Aeribacillus alveayuensis TaxID=279215 RepID=UPI0005CDA36B|nr:hypothetical protein [Bacillus alveayuensis]